SPDSDRESRDIDLFHDAREALAVASTQDEVALRAAGLTVAHDNVWSDTFRRARVSLANTDESVEIDWALDAAWRFFPPIPDPLLGWRLHDIDLACNKVLALGSRSESRDLIDVIAWARTFPLAALCWAACGKDPGFTPLMLLEHMRRSARVDPGQLALFKARHLDAPTIKASWLALASDADAAITALADAMPDLAIGVLFLDSAGIMCWPSVDVSLEQQGLQLHHPTVGGCIPQIRGLPTNDG
ncbi:MAG: hypothetical protein AAB263_16630, partial [Planctomycetota bacterium]